MTTTATAGAATPAAGPVSRAVALRAAEWFVLLHGGDGTPDDFHACDRWRAAAPEHERAWQRALQVSRQAGSLPPALGSPSLRRTQRRATRRDAVRVLAVLITAAPAGWLAWRTVPWNRWAATHVTATGERRDWTLADGSRIVLDTASAVDVAFDADLRLLHLREGAVWVQTAADPQATPARPARPFVVRTADGLVRAIGTQFTVSRQASLSHAAVLQGAVEITPHRGGGAPLRLRAGQQAAFDATAVQPPEPVPPGAGQWSRGVLAVDDMRLGDFVAELARYRPGLLRCDPAVAGLRVTGAFQLADTDAVLLNLAHLLPVRVEYRTRYWVTVAPRSAGA